MQPFFKKAFDKKNQLGTTELQASWWETYMIKGYIFNTGRQCHNSASQLHQNSHFVTRITTDHHLIQAKSGPLAMGKYAEASRCLQFMVNTA